MIIRVPAPALPHLRPALRLAGPAWPLAGFQERRTARATARGRRAAPHQSPAPAGLGRPRNPRRADPVPLENSQRVWVALGGHETCPRPVPGGLAWRGMVAAARVACASVLPGCRPRRGVLSLRVCRAVVLVSGPGSPRTGVHGGDLWGIVLACCPCRRNYPWSPRARKIV